MTDILERIRTRLEPGRMGDLRMNLVLLEAAVAEIERLREALEKEVISCAVESGLVARPVRWCRLCEAHWPTTEQPQHAPTCVLATAALAAEGTK